jgi:hypothetical protein
MTLGTMSPKRDRQPGPVPEIRADGDSVSFRMTVAGEPENTRLVLRCDSNGEVWAAIVAPVPARLNQS